MKGKNKLVSNKNTLLKILFFIIIFLMSINLLSFIYENSGISKYIPINNKYDDENEVIAYIDGEPITLNSTGNKIDSIIYYKNNSENLNFNREIAADYKSIAKFTVSEEVIYREGVKVGIKASRDEISEYQNSIMENLETYLNMSEDEILKKYNISEVDFRKNLEKNIIVYKYLKERTKVDDSEARKYYEENIDEFNEYRYLDILIEKEYIGKNNKKVIRDYEDAREIAMEIMKNLKNGEDFKKTGKEFENKIEGVRYLDMGYINPDEVDGVVDEEIIKLENGKIMDRPVKNRYGYNIIMKVDSRYVNFESIKSNIKEELVYKEQIEILNKLNSEYNVVMNEKYK